MAVSILNSWTAAANTDPDGVMTIDPGSNKRLALLLWTCEFNDQVSFSTMEIGAVSPTGSELIYWENGTADQHVYAWWWNEAAIASFADNDIDSSDAVIASKQTWSFIVFDGVNQNTPVTSSGGTDTNTDQLSIATGSTSNDYDVVAVSRSSANRDITSWGVLTQAWSYAIDYWTGAAGASGGSTPIVVDGDGIAGDITYAHLIINSDTGLSDVNFRGANRGIYVGANRGVY